MRILFLVSSLNPGGAETQLVVLAGGLRERGHEVAIAVLHEGGALAARVAELGLPSFGLGKAGPRDNLRTVLRFRSLVRAWRPEIVHAYMPTSNLLSLACRLAWRRPRVVWGLRTSQRDYRAYGLLSRSVAVLERALAPFADLVIANSEAGMLDWRASATGRTPVECIPNGIDCQRYRPDPAARARVRAEWGVADDQPLVGQVGRLDPVKDQETFLAAAAQVLRASPRARFVCVGGGPVQRREALARLGRELGLAEALVWAGQRADMNAVYNALDLCVMSSRMGEGFPNALGEAMAAGTPCVATDVGDCRRILTPLGAVVPPGRPLELAEAILHALRPGGDPAAVSAACRRHVEERYSVEVLVRTTEARLALLLESSPRPSTT